MHCKNCGKEVNERAAVCPNCGVALNEQTAPAASADRPNAGIRRPGIFDSPGRADSLSGLERDLPAEGEILRKGRADRRDRRGCLLCDRVYRHVRIGGIGRLSPTEICFDRKCEENERAVKRTARLFFSTVKRRCNFLFLKSGGASVFLRTADRARKTAFRYGSLRAAV